MTDPQNVQPVVGHGTSWGMVTPRQRVQPYRLSPGSTDTMRVRVREKIDIRGIGTDVVDMEGIFTVRRDHPCAVGDEVPAWGQSCIKTEFRALELYGESPVFGTVRVHLDPEHASHGEVGPADAGSLAANCVAHCFPTIELPELDLRLSTAGQPVDLASKVIQVPPVGDVARSSNSALLVDENGKTVGEIVSSDIEVGEVLWSVPLGSTAPRGAEPIPHGTGHEAPSGSCFYTKPLSQLPGSAVGSETSGGQAGGHTHGGHTHGGQTTGGRPTGGTSTGGQTTGGQTGAGQGYGGQATGGTGGGTSTGAGGGSAALNDVLSLLQGIEQQFRSLADSIRSNAARR